IFASLPVVLAACSSSSSSGANPSDASNEDASNACELTDDTSPTSTITDGCALLKRDTSACEGDRLGLGLSGAWLKFSCRVDLSIVLGRVQITTDSRPDYKSNYFATNDVCYAPYTTSFPDPSKIAVEHIAMTVPQSPSGAGRSMAGLGVVGVAV